MLRLTAYPIDRIDAIDLTADAETTALTRRYARGSKLLLVLLGLLSFAAAFVFLSHGTLLPTLLASGQILELLEQRCTLGRLGGEYAGRIFWLRVLERGKSLVQRVEFRLRHTHRPAIEVAFF